MTVSLTMTAKRLASKHCVVKQPQSIETLGATSVICTDKTGTLTQNRMTVEWCHVGSQLFPVQHARDDIDGQMAPVADSWAAYARCCRLCSRAEWVDTDTNPNIMKRQCAGDASETAILRCAEHMCRYFT